MLLDVNRALGKEGRGSLFIIKLVSSSYSVRMVSSGRFRDSLNFFTHKTAFEYFKYVLVLKIVKENLWS
jgi:uncharacterized membrane protein YsdA (DUF1294 family)